MRTADRLGLLTGPNLSPVAVLGVRLLMYADNQARLAEQDRQMRLALLARAGTDPARLFPEVFSAAAAGGPVPQEVPEAEEADEVEWKTPSVDQWARMSAALAQRQVAVATSDLDQGWV